ncbi:unnamed protein product [Penicillium salamii]|uniref:Nucleoside phosphorylase domain-containing protein n=1 Tax=Penicillium salamii TaxID=1612424 RepID=A0A9W4IXM0_9EURO|nr:unnamed protein product [Penicillium salamii]
MPTDKKPRPSDHHIEIAIFCALSLEVDAMIAMFDKVEAQEDHRKDPHDTNSYTLGRISGHSVVLVHMPRMGKTSASGVSANLRSTFPNIRLGLLVGICGGVPFSGERDIFLGDVIISTWVVQLDFGRLYPYGFDRKNKTQDNLARPNPEISGFLSKLQGQASRTDLKNQMCADLATTYKSPQHPLSRYPGANNDILFDANYSHKHTDPMACSVCIRCTQPEDNVCAQASTLSCSDLRCDPSKVVRRVRNQITKDQKEDPSSFDPEIHFGGLASGDQVIKSAIHRDHIAREEGVIGFEMEGAGLWDTVPTVVVKGVCDYADSHKSKDWQLYAATTAAACARNLLKKWTASTPPEEKAPHNLEHVPSQAHQIFSGNFTGKSLFNGGTFTAESINFS